MITSLFCQVFRVVGSSSHQLKSVVIHESDFMCQMLCSHGYDLVLIFDHPHMFLSLLSFCIPISVGSLFHIHPTFHGEVIPPWIRIVLGQWIQGYGLGLSFGWHWNPSGISFYRNICVVVSNFLNMVLCSIRFGMLSYFFQQPTTNSCMHTPQKMASPFHHVITFITGWWFENMNFIFPYIGNHPPD